MTYRTIVAEQVIDFAFPGLQVLRSYMSPTPRPVMVVHLPRGSSSSPAMRHLVPPMSRRLLLAATSPLKVSVRARTSFPEIMGGSLPSCDTAAMSQISSAAACGQ